MTQKEIADQLNISRSTVARAFNGGRINEKTKKLILDFAYKNGYKPNNLAQTLVRKNNISIYVFLVDSISPTYVKDIIKGIKVSEKKFSDYKFKINIIQMRASKEKDSEKQYKEILKVLETESPNGLIVSFIDDTYIQNISNLCKSKKIPLITLDTINYEKEKNCHIGPDYIQMGSLTADFIITGLREKGKILILNFEDSCNINKMRVKGFLSFSKNFKDIKIDFINLSSLTQKDFNKALSSCDILEYDCIYSSFKSENIVTYLESNKIDKKYFLIANDLNEDIQNLLYKRKISGIIYQRPFYQGIISIETIFNYLIKKIPIPDKINIGIDILLKENLSIGLYYDFK